MAQTPRLAQTLSSCRTAFLGVGLFSMVTNLLVLAVPYNNVFRRLVVNHFQRWVTWRRAAPSTRRRATTTRS